MQQKLLILYFSLAFTFHIYDSIKHSAKADLNSVVRIIRIK
jgi:hypothetical protein